MDLILVHSNTLLFGTLITLSLLSYAVIKKRSAKSSTHKTAPEPHGAWPLFGHFPMLACSQLPHVILGALADQYGPVFTLWLGLRRVIVVSEAEVAKEIFSGANDKAVTARPPLAAAKLLTYNYAMFPFTPKGSYWHEVRKFSSSELLTKRRLGQVKEPKLQEIGNSVRELYQSWRETKGCQNGRVLIDLKQWFGDLNLNVMLRLVAGKKLLSGDGAAGEKGRRFQKAIREMFKYWGMLILRDAVPFLGWLDVGGHEKEMKRVAKELDEFAEEWLEERRGRREVQQGNYFIDAVTHFLDGKSLGGHDPDTINKATSLSMIAGGNETTTVVMTWAVALLLNNPQALREVQRELDTYVGQHRPVNHEDINNLVYLQAVVKETLRLYPPAPLPAPRQFQQDCIINGYHVPEGTWLIINLGKIHTDPRIWQEPLVFKPERFLTTHKNVDVRGLNFELTPFGSGRRACPAVSFSLQMLYLTLASFLHAFDVSTPGDSLVDMTQSSGLTTVKATPLEVLLSPRLSPECFE